MGYQVKRRGSSWRLVHESYVGKKRRLRSIPKSDWQPLGFVPSMTFEEARQITRDMSVLEWSRFQARRRLATVTRIQKEDATECKLLPEDLCVRFEEEVLKERICWNEETPHLKQLLVYWRTAKRIIRKLKVEPEKWEDKRNTVYSYFKQRKWSLSYAQKVIRVLNLWGKFYAKENNSYFEPVPKPSGEASTRIHEAFYEKRPEGMTSAPILWVEVQAAKGKMEHKHWNWLYLTVWFGLRPSEADRLKWKVEEFKGLTVLAIYQHKLSKLPPEQRWKFIPILFEEQKVGLEILKNEKFKSPSVPVIRRHVNPRASRRGGRKGFIALMWEHGKIPKAIAFRWLGHKSVRTTDNHYTQGLQQACEFELK